MLHLRLIGDDVLRENSKEIDVIDDEIKKLADEMIEVLKKVNGLGLAAPQVGQLVAMVVIDLSEIEEDEEDMLVMINPKIVNQSGKSTFEEGCLSIPGVYANVIRPENITVSYQDLEGQTYLLETGGILARVIQHELDHLQGKLFIDYLEKSVIETVLKDLNQDAYNHLYEESLI